MPSGWHGRRTKAAIAAFVLAMTGCSRQDDSIPAPVASAQSPPRAEQPAAPAMPGAAQGVAPVAVPQSFELLEVGTRTEGGRPLALLRVDGAPAAAYAVGDSLGRGARLRRIAPALVEIERAAGLMTVALTTASAGRERTLLTWQPMRHGAQAATEPPGELPVAGGFGQDRPHGSSIDRAIRRAQVP